MSKTSHKEILYSDVANQHLRFSESQLFLAMYWNRKKKKKHNPSFFVVVDTKGIYARI